VRKIHVQNDDDQGKLYWYAATENNALHEFDDLAACDGINIYNTTPFELLHAARV
jgi:hypothetical protein